MAIDFPGSPSTGQRHSHNNTTWQWDGTSWDRISIDLSTTDAATLSGIAATQFARRDDDNIITGVTTFIGNGYAGVGNTVLIVEGDARVTGVLSVGQGSLAINERDIYAAGVVTATTFVGNVTGNADTCTTATRVTVWPNNSSNATHYITFADAVSGSETIDTDTGLTYNPSTNTVTSSTFIGALTGNAATATKLQTVRTIGGVNFDGSANINLPGVNIAGNQNTSGTAAGLSGTPDITVRNITVTGIQTAEDVKNIDSVGIITARTGIDVTGGTFKADGLVGAAGSVLSSTGSGINWVSPQSGPQGAQGRQGAAGAQGAQGHQGVQGAANATTINNNADNRLITGSGTANTLEAEANITFDGNTLNLVDEKSLYFGTGNDLRLWHNAAGGHHSYIMNHGAGVLKIGSDTQLIIGKTGNATYIECNPDNTVKLFYNNVPTAQTVPNGFRIDGDEGQYGYLYMYSDQGDDCLLYTSPSPRDS